MEIKYKLYPYPVLTTYSDDYQHGKFEATIDIVRDGYNLRVDFVASLTSTGLKEQIKAGMAKYVYHLECAQTGFRKVVSTDKVAESYIIDNKLVSGKLQICPFIVAVEDIKGYTTEDFHSDYTPFFTSSLYSLYVTISTQSRLHTSCEKEFTIPQTAIVRTCVSAFSGHSAAPVHPGYRPSGVCLSAPYPLAAAPVSWSIPEFLLSTGIPPKFCHTPAAAPCRSPWHGSHCTLLGTCSCGCNGKSDVCFPCTP